jgi:predicted cupin superfamily sugar epimerase
MGSWSLVTCCVAPGFDFQDFQLLRELPRELHPLGAMESLL